MLYRPITIGDLTFEGNVFLAPMAGFTDRAFREITADWGCSLAFTEMVSCEALIRDSIRTQDLMRPYDGEKNLAIQIFSGSVDSAAHAAEKLIPYKPVLIDINCGCPVPKITKSGAGSALLKEPSVIREMVKAVKEASGLPVTVKIRSGWDASMINYRETASAAVDGGACMVSLHPRTKKQGYSGTSKWEHIQDLKNYLPVPVCGSGDLFSADGVKSMLETTGCDAVMIARGAQGNPFIFQESLALLTGRSEPEIPLEERIRTGLRQLRRCAFYEGPEIAVKEMKKQLCAYTKGFPGGSEFRSRLVRAHQIDELFFIINEFLERQENPRLKSPRP